MSLRLRVSVTVAPRNQLIVVVFNYDCCLSIMIVVSLVVVTVFVADHDGYRWSIDQDFVRTVARTCPSGVVDDLDHSFARKKLAYAHFDAPTIGLTYCELLDVVTAVVVGFTMSPTTSVVGCKGGLLLLIFYLLLM